MEILSPKQAIEHFQLLFLGHLGRYVDKNLYILKGGCNLRFFMKGFRYSEDLDLDIKKMSKDTLKKNVNRLLESPPFRKGLLSRNISIQDCSAPKQTETTQRWKLMLRVEGWQVPLHTKVEFSRRAMADDYIFEQIDPSLSQGYALFPISTNHYTPEATMLHKIRALAHRSTVQCRDFFDLHLLIQSGIKIEAYKGLTKSELRDAVEHGRQLSYEDYLGQVVAFLISECQQEYISQKTWETLQKSVFGFLDRVNNEIN